MMGDGLKRVAKICGGLTATDGRTTVVYDGDGNRRFDAAHKRALARKRIYQEYHDKRMQALFEREFFGQP